MQISADLDSTEKVSLYILNHWGKQRKKKTVGEDSSIPSSRMPSKE